MLRLPALNALGFNKLGERLKSFLNRFSVGTIRLVGFKNFSRA